MCLSCWVKTLTTNLTSYIKAHLLLWVNRGILACFLAFIRKFAILFFFSYSHACGCVFLLFFLWCWESNSSGSCNLDKYFSTELLISPSTSALLCWFWGRVSHDSDWPWTLYRLAFNLLNTEIMRLYHKSGQFFRCKTPALMTTFTVYVTITNCLFSKYSPHFRHSLMIR